MTRLSRRAFGKLLGVFGLGAGVAEAGSTLRVTLDGPIPLLSSMEALPR